MSFGNAFITLCSSIVILCSAPAYAQVDIPANLHIKATESMEAYTNYILKFDKCNNKESRKNNPYPINDWLISLPREKQIRVIFYLHQLAEYNCVLDEQVILINTLKKHNENKALLILEKEGWFKEPIYGTSSFKKINQNKVRLNENDQKALRTLVDINYLPFNGIGMDEIIRKLEIKEN